MSGHGATHETAFNFNDNPFFFTDPHGSTPQHGPVSDNLPDNVGATSELDSSEDEVLFMGRQTQTARNDVEPPRVRPLSTASSVVVRVIEDDIQFPPQPDTDSLAKEWESPLPENPQDLLEDDFIGLSTKNRRAKKRARNNNKKKSTLNYDDAILADYVRNVSRQDESSDDELPDIDELGLSSKDKAKFRALSTLDTVEESSLHASKEVNDDDISDDDPEDSDDSSSLEELLSHIRRGASFTMLEDSWANDFSLEGENFDVDFDMIDMQRDGPLKKKKKKKGKRQMDFGLSDSELELHLEEVWEKDRKTKRDKKKEREQLRAEGLLGKKKKPDRRPKDGAFGMDGLKVELKEFLQSQSESLDLPPMKKHHRRVVHELANALALKSVSRGQGNARYPVLYKTVRTPNFNGKHSVQLDKILAQPRFNRQSGRMSAGANFREKEPKNNRRRPNMSASYVEGEVVGGSAPEIGANNKGRAMLEKMGWSSGTALGALNNKGILQPVSQVVKNTRAGLG